MQIGIACSAGSYKGIFVHGVLAALEDAGFRAQVYAACSSSAVPAAFASVGELEQLNRTQYWKEGYSRYVQAGYDISKSLLDSLPEAVEALEGKLFRPNAERYAIAVNAVVTREAADMTQGLGARRLGIQLLRAMKNKDRSWPDKHLELRLFKNWTADGGFMLTQDNLKDVLYATTRMLHAWRTPSWIDSLPYVDASYTCLCPAIELTRLACDRVVAISPELGDVYRDLFQTEVLPTSHDSVPIDIIQPQVDLAEIGVDYLKVTDEGLETAFEFGREAGKTYLSLGRMKAL